MSTATDTRLWVQGPVRMKVPYYDANLGSTFTDEVYAYTYRHARAISAASSGRINALAGRVVHREVSRGGV